MSDRVTVEVADHIAHVTLNRADKMNAVDRAMLEGLAEAAAQVAASDARVAILSGDGKAFCAGLDVASFASVAQDKDVLLGRSHGDGNIFQHASLAWHDLPIPVIGALHHTVFGAGFQVAIGADIRIAAPETRFSIMEMKWGLVPDMGGMVLLPRLAPADVVRRLTYTAEVFEADDALAWGLITEIADDPHARARDLATEIANKSPSAIRAAKRLLKVAEGDAPRADVLMAETQEQADLIGGPHQMEAVMANMAKRPPVFK
ncbi:MAG: crotonase/enoyl-CoA hydratase family protein [Pseudomonadota bacterium]